MLLLDVLAVKTTAPWTVRPSRPSRPKAPVIRRAKPPDGPCLKATVALRMTTPVASGLAEPSGLVTGPRPTKISSPVPVNWPAEMANCPALISRMPPKSKCRSWTRNWTVGVPGTSMETVVSLTSTLCLTATPVVLNATPTEAPAEKPVSATCTAPVMVPATPPDVVTMAASAELVWVPAPKKTSTPCPLTRPGLVPLPGSVWALLSVALAKANRVTCAPAGPTRSMATSAWSVTPATPMSTLVAANRRYGPFGSASTLTFARSSGWSPVAAQLTV